MAKGCTKMIDPLTALAGIQSAVKLIKQASKTVDDVASLGPVLGKYFDAKSTASKAAASAKKSKSSMGTAIQIELALEQARAFEEELKMIFIASNKIDVFNKIKARAEAMDVEAAHEARREREAEKKRKEKEEEQLTWAIAFVVLILLGTFIAMGISEMVDFCAKNRCGR
jgi:hypothetical protein